MTTPELEQLQALAASQIEKNVAAGPLLLALPSELRNKIYTLVAMDQGQQNGLAGANKQISREYLSILNSKEMLRAKYMEDVDTTKWIEFDTRKIQKAVAIYCRRNPHFLRKTCALPGDVPFTLRLKSTSSNMRNRGPSVPWS
ncbi:hypothetical protein CKM354_000985300 [Cercospora kikuchii]|uniref:Uncharacterized protein n=1 Tax=Cercospora kikuchii TaxID=84275 RepID=A0A9P3FKL0_9PEZI|nr:uncharacterized protein CKM354_000985300 [Cercospora kikuchii]GIZ46740.1 hypothetical protein CKM354_000985300 [Cercospora kikuchii]